MKKILYFLIVALFVFSDQLFAKEAPEQLLIKMPKEVGGFKSGRMIMYGDVRLGYSLEYRDEEDSQVIFYIYDLGNSTIEEGISSPVIEEVKNTAIEELKRPKVRDNFGNVKVLLDADKVFEMENGSMIETKWIICTYDVFIPESEKFISVISEIYVTGVKGNICKIQLTRLKDMDEQRQSEVEKALEMMISSIVS
ncbi:MAG: hypothetical protein PHQ52_06270 [Candidatus Omnitrophica bacterium]|nr:hypothetical protein [Candidatus Omnitrophota bacterium]